MLQIRVIYLVTCRRPGCTAQYCGSTSTCMMRRHAGHRQEVREGSSPLGRHFSVCGYQNFSLQIIDCVKEGEEEGLGRLEGFWQNNLATFEETGAINRRDEMTVRRSQTIIVVTSYNNHTSQVVTSSNKFYVIVACTLCSNYFQFSLCLKYVLKLWGWSRGLNPRTGHVLPDKPSLSS